MKLRDLLRENIHSWAHDIRKKYDLETLQVSEDFEIIYLNFIMVKPEYRDQKIGSKVMQSLCDYADSVGKKIALSPTKRNADFGTTSQSRLIDFYKKFDFVLNKGRNKDFTISELMFRLPK